MPYAAFYNGFVDLTHANSEASAPQNMAVLSSKPFAATEYVDASQCGWSQGAARMEA